MNGNEDHGREEGRTRREVLATAGGLLLPAGLLTRLDLDDVEATREAKRRRQRRRDKPGMFANDVIVNFRNATNEQRDCAFSAQQSLNHWRSLAPGQESGFAPGVPPAQLTGTMSLRLPRPGSDFARHSVVCHNPEVGSPTVDIYWIPNPCKLCWVRLADEIAMGEDTTLEVTYGGYRFHVHRWTNGKEPLDDYDEWYTRFFVTMSNA